MMNRPVDFKNLPLSNDFLFGEVMRREHLCKLFLEELLQKEIDHIEYIDKQQDLSDSYLFHGVRLDVYLRDSNNTVYDVEMQTVNNHDLERRTRYYQAAIDCRTLDRNTYYSEFPESYVIFICTFDYFGAGDMIYERVSHIRNHPEKPYIDGSHSLILNCDYNPSTATNPAIQEFLDYIKNNNHDVVFKSELANEARRVAEEIRNNEKNESAYMTMRMKMIDECMAGIREGIEISRVNDITAVMESLSCDVTKAMNLLRIPDSEQPRYAELLIRK